MKRNVYNVTLSEVKKAAQTLHQAFRMDELMQWLAVTPENYDDNGRALFETWVTYGVRYGIVFRTDNFESIAIRRKPGDIKFSLWKMFRSGMFKTPKLLGKTGIKRVEILGKFCDKAKADTMPEQKFWHCWMLGTQPEKQKQGFGRALMEATFQIARADKLPCYLETIKASNAEKVHKHMGYTPLTTIFLPESDIVLTTMIHHPKN